MFTDIAVGLVFGLSQISDNMQSATDRIWQADFAGAVARVVPLPPAFELVYRSGLTLPEDVQAAFDNDFAGGPYFGAFAIAKDFSFGYIAGANSRAAAAEIARLECARHAPEATPNCIIYAEFLPIGYADLAPDEIALSPEAAALFQNPGKRGRFRAMAASDDGAYSLVWAHASQAEADAAAIADCDQYRITDMAGLRDMPCRVLPGLP